MTLPTLVIVLLLFLLGILFGLLFQDRSLEALALLVGLVEEDAGAVGTEAHFGADPDAPSGCEALAKVDQRFIPIPADGLCCSLDHDIRIVEL
mgnify:CR=1 FL=1